MKTIVLKSVGFLASLALIVTSSNVNSTCFFVMHQPMLPVGFEKLKIKG